MPRSVCFVNGSPEGGCWPDENWLGELVSLPVPGLTLLRAVTCLKALRAPEKLLAHVLLALVAVGAVERRQLLWNLVIKDGIKEELKNARVI